jgi:two-component system OmpR family sensor kinase
MTAARRPLARTLTQRLTLIALGVVALNVVVVGAYYGSDRPALEAEAVADMTDRLGAALEGVILPGNAPVRAIFADHPDAYAYALVDRTGVVIGAMNADLIPPSAADLYADDWITRIDLPQMRRVIAGHEFADRTDGLRVIFVMNADPAGLLRRAYFSELRQHVWAPVLPMAIVLIVASVLLIRRELAPVARAAAWARAIRPGAVTPPPDGDLPAEVADLIEATDRALNRLATALAAETRHAAEAAHALRTPVAVLVARLDALPQGETTDRLRADLAALARTVQQVLAAARTDVLAVPDKMALDLRDAAQAVTAALSPFAYEKGVELALSLPDAPVLARANREGVELALSNLIENAVLHGGPGLVEISVGPALTITVRDHGPGLPAVAGSQLFKAFWRGPAAVPGGTGLGLAVVERLQQAQSGEVSAQNAADGGCQIVLSYQSA